MSISDEERRTFTERDLWTLSGADDAVDPRTEGRAWVRLGDAMSRALYAFERGVSAGPEPQVVPRRGPVETAIVVRARTRDIRERALAHREAARRAFRILDASPRDGSGSRRFEVLIALSLAAGQARCLSRRLTHLPPPASPRVIALVDALGTALAESGRALEAIQGGLREMPVSDGPARCDPAAVPDAVAAAVRLAIALEEEVRAEAVDASGADLSRLDLVDTGPLAGVVWSRTTVWPVRIAPMIRARSHRVAAGVYRVRRTYGG
ncbi:hypothetical protein OG948_45860 (plasmid) [Embleya sp. NBC_00888]|uniref:hypothetical protein n=1 Tax=Embleya sp. NBC_00888 TaxID=2975960 RepID=UPI002F914C8B|nr:hypothetical protein OG948_45860 [Embleya sp. NBC_00888]